MKSKQDGQLVLLHEEHSGRDEMNLAGNPFALLQATKDGQNLIRSEWEKTLPNGKIVTASWEVSGHQKLGLPGPSDELLFLVLMQLTREQSGNGDWIQTVHFSRFDLVNRLGWPLTATYYNMLHDGLKRLSSVNITACHTFWDARAKTYADMVSFHILEEFTIYNEPKGKKASGSQPLSSFKWSDKVHQSFLAGNVRSLALNFIISLDLPTTRRLFRFLDMMRGATSPPRRDFTIGLFKLCERLGMTQYKYASKIKDKLKDANNELISRGYLADVEYTKGKDGVEMAVFRFAEVSKEVGQGSAPRPPKKGAKPSAASAVADQLALTNPIAEKSSSGDIRLDALRCYEIFQSLDDDEQGELMDLAKKDVSPIWHDRVGQPESPMSLGLWQLVAARYPEKVK